MEEEQFFQLKRHVTHVQLSRSQKSNEINSDMFSAIADAGLRIRKDKSIRAVVISG